MTTALFGVQPPHKAKRHALSGSGQHMLRGVAAGSTDRRDAAAAGGSASSSDSDGSDDGDAHLSSDDERPSPRGRHGGQAIPASLSTVWAKRWGSSVPAVGLYPGAPLRERSPSARPPQPPPPPATPVRPASGWCGRCGARACAALDSLLAALPIALLSYATSTSYAMLIVEGARPLTPGRVMG